VSQAPIVQSAAAPKSVDSRTAKTRILILGGGFGGVYTAGHLEKLCKDRSDVEIVLVSRDNFLLMTPLLFEVCSGTLDLRHCSFPIRAFLRTTRFVEATVQGIDLERRVVHLAVGGERDELGYDQLVLALGARTNRAMIPGSEHAFTFKTLADALLLRSHVIERLERADVEPDPQRKRALLTFAIIGGGLVGVELFGELTAFVDGVAPLYKHVNRDEMRFLLLQGGDRIMPEINAKLAEYGARVLSQRRSAEIRTNAHVRAIEPGRICLAAASGGPSAQSEHTGEGETIEAATIVLAAGIVPNPVVAELPVAKDRRGHILVDGAMRCPSRPEVWALGDCASIPAPDGKVYPNLAQHALREAKALARNILSVLNGRPPQPFVYDTLGMMGSLGHGRAFGQLLKVPVRGIVAWFVRRTYYLMQMPGWARRLRIMIDWTFALLFRPDIVKISLDSETAMMLREAAAGDAPEPGKNEVARTKIEDNRPRRENGSSLSPRPSSV
jgi:NADH:ubiquinone reductase (H+-translocating)